MNILSEIFILARNDDTGFEWVVPVIVIVIWIIGGIGKAIAAARDERKRRERLNSSVGQAQKKMRYKPIPDTSTQQRRERAVPQEVPVERVRETVKAERQERKKPVGAVASLKKAMQEALEDAYAQQAKRQAPKPRARKAKKVQRKVEHKAPKPVPVQEPVVEVEDVRQEGSILSELLESENIRKAIIYSEILGKPLSMREQGY